MTLIRGIIPLDSSRLEEKISDARSEFRRIIKDKQSLYLILCGCLTKLLDKQKIDYDEMMKNIFHRGVSLSQDEYIAVFLTNLRKGGDEYTPLIEFLNNSNGQVGSAIVNAGLKGDFDFYYALGLRIEAEAEMLGLVRKELEIATQRCPLEKYPAAGRIFFYIGPD